MNKRRIALMTAVILIAAGFILRSRLAERAEQKRLPEYQGVAKFYSDALTPGTSRAEVEAFIRSRHENFAQMCCVGSVPRNAWADLIKLGERTSPSLKWPCDRTNLFVAFEFAEEPPRSQFNVSQVKAADNDKLISVSLFEQPQPCL
jgi:hypothetical protein